MLLLLLLRVLFAIILAALSGCTQPTALRVHLDAATQPSALVITVSVTGGHAPVVRALDSPRLPGLVVVILPDATETVSISVDGSDVNGARLHGGASMVSVPHSEVAITIDLSPPLPDGGSDLAPGGADMAKPANDLASPDLAPVIDPTAWYNIVNVNSGLCVEAFNAGTSDGTTIDQWACGNGATWQQWQFLPTDSGYYEVVNRNAPNHVLEVKGGPTSTAAGDIVDLWAWHSGLAQQWMPIATLAGHFTFVPRHVTECLDVTASSTSNGAQVQQWDCNDTGAQLFQLIKQ
jgi:hypothetical protein